MERRRRERGTSKPVKVFLRCLIGSINYPKKILQSEGPTKYVSLWKSLSSHSNCLKREASVIGNVNGTQSFNTYLTLALKSTLKIFLRPLLNCRQKLIKLQPVVKKKDTTSNHCNFDSTLIFLGNEMYIFGIHWITLTFISLC